MKKIILTLISLIIILAPLSYTLKAEELSNININIAKFDDNKVEIKLDSNEVTYNLELDYRVDGGKWLSEDFDNLIALSYNPKTHMYEHAFNEEIKFYKSFEVRIRALVNGTKTAFSNIMTFKSTLNAKNYDAWAMDAIHRADSLGIVYETMREDMKANATRLEFVESLVKAIEYKKSIKDYVNEDVKDTISIAVRKAYKLNLLVYNDKHLFYPDRFITREEVAAILDRLTEIISFEDKNENKVSYDDASEWAKKSIDSVIKKGLMIGDKNLKFNPKNNITRQEVLVTVLRTIE